MSVSREPMESLRDEIVDLSSAEAMPPPCVPEPGNLCSRLAGTAKISRSAPSGAECAATPSSPERARDLADAPRAGAEQHWRTGTRQPTVEERKGRQLPFTLKLFYAPHPGAKKAAYRSATSSAPGYAKAWATRAAAELHKAEFKAWVDWEMNKPQRGGAAAAAASRAAAPADAAPPTRYSARRGATKVRVELSLHVDGGARVLGGVHVVQLLDFKAMEVEWLGRSIDYRRAARERRAEGLAEAMASAKARTSDERWKLFLEKCRSIHDPDVKLAPARAKRGRGKARGQLVGVLERLHDRRRAVERREQQMVKQQKQLREDTVVRARAVERLAQALLSGDVKPLLRREPAAGGEQTADGEPDAELSAAQVSRLTVQGMAVVKMLEEEQRLQDAYENGCAPPCTAAPPRIPHTVACGRSPAPKKGVIWQAAETAADYFCKFQRLGASTLRTWRHEFMTSAEDSEARGFAPDRRGKWERELLIHEEDLKLKFRKWMVKQAKGESLSKEAACKYLNEELLVAPRVTPELLADYHVKLPIGLSTTLRWMKACGAVAGKYKQSYYNDSHESALVVKDRQARA